MAEWCRVVQPNVTRLDVQFDKYRVLFGIGSLHTIQREIYRVRVLHCEGLLWRDIKWN